MKVFHIDQFKCTLCSNWFCPPFNLPYLLKCSHSICYNCLKKSIDNRSHQIICPQDFHKNKINQIQINQSTKKALERLLKEHHNFNKTNDLQCIKLLSINFDQILDSKEIQLKNLSTLIDQIFQNQIKRLKEIYQNIKTQINRPFRIVNDWKQVVRNYLKKIKQTGSNSKGLVNQLNHYIQEGRKIKLDLNEYLKYDFKSLIDYLLIQPTVCFTHNFTIFDQINMQIQKENQHQYKHKLLSANIAQNNNIKNNNITKIKDNFSFQTLMNQNVHVNHATNRNRGGFKQVQLKDITNFDQSSIICPKKYDLLQHPNNKNSLYQELMEQTSKYNSKLNKIKNGYQDNNENKLNNLQLKYRNKSDNASNYNKSINNANNSINNSINNPNISMSNANNSINNSYNNQNANNSSNNTSGMIINKASSSSFIYPFVQESQDEYSLQKNIQSLQNIDFSRDIQNQQQNYIKSNNNYNSVIKSKIKKLKQSNLNVNVNVKNVQENNKSQRNDRTLLNVNSINGNQKFNQNSQIIDNIKTNSKYGNSLQYSPNSLEKYAVFDSYNINQNSYMKQKGQLSMIKPIKVPFMSPCKQQEQPYQEAHSLQSYYQQSTTLNNKNNMNNFDNKKCQIVPMHTNVKNKNKQNQQQQEQLLLDSQPQRKVKSPTKKNDWHMENINFLKEWKINKNQKEESPLEIIQKYGGYNCQKQKDRYIRKIQENKARQLFEQTNIGQNYIELVGQSLADCNLTLFLNQFDWNQRDFEIVKFIRTSINDNQMNQLLNFLVYSNVHTLMLSYNNLTEISLDALLNFVQINKKLKNIYVPKNNISLLKGNSKAKINLLKQKGINLYF